jgi:PleD family two-component response regulator
MVMKTPEPKTVLAVDDDPQALLALMTRLSRAGFNVQTATRGETALRIARACAADVILLNTALSGEIDGLAVAAALRSTPETSKVPVVFAIPDTDGRVMEQCKAMGGRYFVTKPFDMERLARVVNAAAWGDQLAEIEVHAESAVSRRQS